ncbi:hypothetical protein HYH85_11330 [Clostridium botulinum]|uniref:hypothetical protein n=1 Tax=Clostridium botulinum TaxID=1491 RepID=UPI001C9B044F|nr:hypothetical protein [Clostridium botulinum]MBY6796845.1 hypothetical protein [Clostridium botulinum]MBY6866731.1 hypothetical protein [Clostridium botulinum]HDI3056377.1 hypothetical protein [Clostridium botulinum]
MDLLDKFNELHSKGYSMQNIVENIFLNYNAYTNNDDIYFLKKKISSYFKVELNNVKLIGSSHTGFKEFRPREQTKDYDFAIIDPFLFREFLLKIKTNQMNMHSMELYVKNLAEGKLHILYSNKEIKTNIKMILEDIKLQIEEEEKIKIDKDISVCFYISEKAFINNLTGYFNRVLAASIRNENSEIKALEKLH